MQSKKADPCDGRVLHRRFGGSNALSEIPGSSLVLDRGFVTYSNDAKQQTLGVTPATIDVYGAVSTECAEEMAKGALAHASVDLAISITGVAGPTGAVRGKPIGLVYFCAASRSGRVIAHDRKYGDIGRETCGRSPSYRRWPCFGNWRKKKNLARLREKASVA